MKKPSLKHYLACGLAAYSAAVFVCGAVFRLQSEMQHQMVDTQITEAEQIKANNERYATQKVASTNLMISGTIAMGVAVIAKTVDILDEKENKNSKEDEKTK